jgi:hypothetical protein
MMEIREGRALRLAIERADDRVCGGRQARAALAPIAARAQRADEIRQGVAAQRSTLRG